ncbi:catalase [Terrarubrum flagellatum]|uniref:catalase n=1 Tax=Terrirubrum flagellatum TaxID=2895980 RepID=UPI0031454FF8
MPQNSQYRSAEEIVTKIKRILGDYPKHRALHADGRLYRGVFVANAKAAQFTRAVHMQGDEIPVTVRFSKGGGDPFAHFGNTVGMATRFYLPDGRVTHVVMLSQKLFVANSVEQFLALLEAGLPTEPGGPINKTALQAFLANNANTAQVLKMRAESPAPVSFAHTEFNAVHVFRFLNEAGNATHARCHWAPVSGTKGQPVASLAQSEVDSLYRELEHRLLSGVGAEFDFVLELAEDGDPLNDATALWPKGRKRIDIGRLKLLSPITEEDVGDHVMNHDPTMLVDGIEPTDDPILQIRRGVYEVSAARRSGGWRSIQGDHAKDGA